MQNCASMPIIHRAIMGVSTQSTFFLIYCVWFNKRNRIQSSKVSTRSAQSEPADYHILKFVW